eukprot:GFUD01030943.1.p1 GENE.GFUD01030943.1~~GFUD01030943.1.p1  ORF type:complete len:435 (-),score=97.54 GFUD01030943.1:70-1374(-)
MFLLILHIFLLSLAQSQFQPPVSYSTFPCDLSYNTSLYPANVRIEATDLAGNELNTTGVFKKTGTFNGYPVYRKQFLYLDKSEPRMIFPDQDQKKGILRQSAQNIFLNNLGQWELVEDGFLSGHIRQELPCKPRLNTTAPWQFSSKTGVTRQIKLETKPLGLVDYPDFYEITSAPLQIQGFYAQTSAFQSDAPIYKKPGVGNMQNYLFLYKGSWMVAKDPMANSLTYRMYQQSQGSRTPLSSVPWNIVTNDGRIEESPDTKASAVQQARPMSYSIQTTGSAMDKLPSLMGTYKLTNKTKNKNIPIYQEEKTKQYLYQNSDGSWVVGPSLTSSNGILLNQDSKGSPLPSAIVPWRFYSNGWHTDNDLRASAEISPEAKAAAVRLAMSTAFPILAIILIIIIVIAIICCLKRRKATNLHVKNPQEQPATLRKISKL